MSSKSGISFGASSSINSNLQGTSTRLGCRGGVSGSPWSGCRGVAGMGCDCGCRVASLGISWMQRYSLLSGNGCLCHMGSSSSTIRRFASSSLDSAANASGDVSLKVSHQQTLLRMTGLWDVLE